MALLDDVDLDIETLASVGAGVGAANWGAQELLSTNFLADLLGTNVGLGYIAVGAAGVVVITERLGVTEVFD
ncbi:MULTISPECIES: hypothetical protein [Haloferax]|uniref:Uncharacterized protein n=1 Tax=Haloferax larsenii TaxID=302484 RepID=A0A1H7KIZ2_HALLR|nr:hypothetical protein [Haloferax larsenii]SEK86742.1 hypothetical protein SAMN04488691_10220 [Haloferax larsenii]